jgi:3D (Asp-Asp-Asp) domain-containing protein
LEGGNGRDGSPVGSGEAATSHSGQTLDRLRGKRCAAVDPNVLEIRGD